MTEVTAVLYRWVRGTSKHEISRSLGISRNTVRTLILASEKEELYVGCNDESKLLSVSQKISAAQNRHRERNKPVTEKLKPYHDKIGLWLTEQNITVKQIWRILREQQQPVIVGITSLHRYVDKYFKQKKINSTTVLPTIPGQQAQVDFGYVGKMHDPLTNKNRKTWVFVMTLAHSRYRYAYFVFKQDVVTWIECHRRAFEFFGGVPKTILLDNLKAGVIKADIYDPTINRTYAEFERHYGFVADPAKVRKPEHKGKVERSILIVKQQLIAGRKFIDINEANKYARHWAEQIIANVVTRTTGETPKQRFEREDKPALLALPAKSFEHSTWSEGIVGRDQHVTFQGCFYSVPEQHIGKIVSIKATSSIVRFYFNNTHIKSHPIAAKKGQWRTDITDLNKAAQHYLKNTPELCIGKAKLIGESTYKVIKSTLHRPTTARLRKAQAILRLAQKYSKPRLEAACHRAISFNNTEYKTLQNILSQELDKDTCSTVPMLSSEELAEGAFLRNPSDFMIH